MKPAHARYARALSPLADRLNVSDWQAGQILTDFQHQRRLYWKTSVIDQREALHFIQQLSSPDAGGFPYKITEQSCSHPGLCNGEEGNSHVFNVCFPIAGTRIEILSSEPQPISSSVPWEILYTMVPVSYAAMYPASSFSIHVSTSRILSSNLPKRESTIEELTAQQTTDACVVTAEQLHPGH